LIKEEELISKLEDFGLSKNDAAVYLGLLRTGPTKASQICNFTKINRVKVYRILENLKKLGFVSSTFSNPTVYSANSLSESLHGIIKRKKFEEERLEKLISYVAKNYDAPEYNIRQTDSPQFTIISGRYSIYMHVEKMINEAKEDIYVVTPYSDLATMYFTSIPESISKAKQNGVKIKFVTDMKSDDDIGIIDRMGIDDFRMSNLPSKGRIVCTKSETLVSGYTGGTAGLNSEEDSALVTNSDEFVRNMKCLSIQLWKAGKVHSSLKQRKKGIRV